MTRLCHVSFSTKIPLNPTKFEGFKNQMNCFVDKLCEFKYHYGNQEMFYESPNCRISAAYLFESSESDLTKPIAHFVVDPDNFSMVLRLNITQLTQPAYKIRAFIGSQRGALNSAESEPIEIVRKCTAQPAIWRLRRDGTGFETNETRIISYYKYSDYLKKESYRFESA